MTRTEQNRTEQAKIYCYYLSIAGWHRVARVVLNPAGTCTTIHCQSNNLLQKVIVKVDK